MKVDLKNVDAPARAFLTTYQRAWNAPSVDSLSTMWHDDAEMHHPEFPEPLVGLEAILAYASNFLALAPDLHVRPLAAAGSASALFVEFEAAGTFLGTPITWRGVDKFELRGDRAARGVGYFDTQAIREALASGASPR